MKKKSTLLIVTILLSAHFVFAQQLTCSTGNTIKNDTWVIEYAVGEIAVTTLSSSGNFATQGLLQPSVKVINPACTFINDDFVYFPNPTKDKIRLVGRFDWISSYIIYAADGKLMAKSPLYNNYIDLTKLAKGLYIIQLLPGCDGQFKTLKILKQ
jgi:hypothetical protein